VRKSITPFIIQLAFDSPGCTLPVITTPFFFGIYEKEGSPDLLLVMVRYSHLLPAIVLQRVFLVTKSNFFYCKTAKSSYKSV
jgi:hypothetical protein